MCLHVLQLDDADRDQGLGKPGDVGPQRRHLGLERAGLRAGVVGEALTPAEIHREEPHRADLRLVEHVRTTAVLRRLGLRLALALALGLLPLALRRRWGLARGFSLGTQIVLEVLIRADVDRDQPQGADLGLVEQVGTGQGVARDHLLGALHGLGDGGLGDPRGHVEVRLHSVDHENLPGCATTGPYPTPAESRPPSRESRRCLDDVEARLGPGSGAGAAHGVLPALPTGTDFHREAPGLREGTRFSR